MDENKGVIEFVSGKLVSGGGLCEGCGRRIQEGEKVFTPAGLVDEIKEFLYCRECRPAEDGLPEGILSVEPALAVEEPGEDERRMGIEVKAGSSCCGCGRVFEKGDWLLVGVVEGLHRGFVYCRECYLILREQDISAEKLE
ncbi:MAG: hypothetical protein SWK76_12775 [Actinomycetota bacterium]|nr:hypothetical protein [Actinomycetota bacterium]